MIVYHPTILPEPRLARNNLCTMKVNLHDLKLQARDLPTRLLPPSLCHRPASLMFRNVCHCLTKADEASAGYAEPSQCTQFGPVKTQAPVECV